MEEKKRKKSGYDFRKEKRNKMLQESAEACPKITAFLSKPSDCEATPSLEIENDNELSSQGRAKSADSIDEQCLVKEFPETCLNSHNVETTSEKLPELVSSTLKPHSSQGTSFDTPTEDIDYFKKP